MRQINTHKVNGLNESIELTARDERGDGNANHHYTATRPAGLSDRVVDLNVVFQKGPLKENACNGFTNEVLLAILIDRMQGFQAGPFASRDNAVALTNLEQAMMWLQKRTRDRMARGVEGTHQQ